MKQEVVFPNNSSLTVGNLNYAFSVDVNNNLIANISCQISATGMVLNDQPTNNNDLQAGNIYVAIGSNIADMNQISSSITANGASAVFTNLALHIDARKKDLAAFRIEELVAFIHKMTTQ